MKPEKKRWIRIWIRFTNYLTKRICLCSHSRRIKDRQIFNLLSSATNFSFYLGAFKLILFRWDPIRILFRRKSRPKWQFSMLQIWIGRKWKRTATLLFVFFFFTFCRLRNRKRTNRCWGASLNYLTTPTRWKRWLTIKELTSTWALLPTSISASCRWVAHFVFLTLEGEVDVLKGFKLNDRGYGPRRRHLYDQGLASVVVFPSGNSFIVKRRYKITQVPYFSCFFSFFFCKEFEECGKVERYHVRYRIIGYTIRYCFSADCLCWNNVGRSSCLFSPTLFWQKSFYMWYFLFFYVCMFYWKLLYIYG